MSPSPFSLVLSGLLGMGMLCCEGTAPGEHGAPIAPDDAAAGPPPDAPVPAAPAPDAGGAPGPVVVAGGIGVSDLAASRSFYQSVFDLTFVEQEVSPAS